MQSVIAETVERDFTLLSNLKAQVLLAERRVVRLRKAIFAKAFCGQLVLQDPNDQPARIPLQRIQAERKNNTAAPRHDVEDNGTWRNKVNV